MTEVPATDVKVKFEIMEASSDSNEQLQQHQQSSSNGIKPPLWNGLK
jgi:hypothetical protein